MTQLPRTPPLPPSVEGSVPCRARVSHRAASGLAASGLGLGAARRLGRCLLALSLLAASSTTTVDLHAEDEPAPDDAADVAGAATAAPSPADSNQASDSPSHPPRPLPELPEPPSIALPDADKADLKALDALLARLTDAEPIVRERAVRELLEVKGRWTPALHTRIDGLADRANKTAMRDALERIRSEKRKELRASSTDGTSDRSDYLDMVVERAEPTSETWRNLVHVLAMSRMLRHIGTAAAARSLVHVYVRYGEFLRINTQLELEAMGDRSLAALIEARRHPAQKIAQWAERQLDLRGKAIAGEALRTEDPEALADILRAFGRIRDPDAARIIISFAQSERAQLRGAAREALALLGEVATWQLRDAYENTMGKRASREWSWQRTARELFSEFDRLRQAEQYDLFEQGLAAHQAAKLEEMVALYDRVLAFNPMFERRDEMSAGYLDYARAHGAQHPDRAVAALRRAERVASGEKERRALQSLRLTFEARQLLDQGIVDQGLLHQAAALDPNNRLAEETLEAALTGETTPLSRTSRYWGAGAIALVSLLGAGGILWIGARRRRSLATQPPDATAEDAIPDDLTDDDLTDDDPSNYDDTSNYDDPTQDDAPAVNATAAPAPDTRDGALPMGEAPSDDDPPDPTPIPDDPTDPAPTDEEHGDDTAVDSPLHDPSQRKTPEPERH